MRAFFLFSAVVVLTACESGNSTTAPSGHGASPASTANANVNAAYPPGPNAKPTGGAAVTVIETAVNKMIDGISSLGALDAAKCPAGTTVVSGGYSIDQGWSQARVAYSGPDGANGWKVVVDDAGVTPIWFHVFATCLP